MRLLVLLAACALTTACNQERPSPPLPDASGAPARAPQVSAETDAQVQGTIYNATGDVACSGLSGAGDRTCQGGAIRRTDGSADLVVTLEGARRVLQFDPEARAVASDLSGQPVSSTIEDVDWVEVRVGEERYRLPLALLKGG